jgi:hypothetical protein
LYPAAEIGTDPPRAEMFTQKLPTASMHFWLNSKPRVISRDVCATSFGLQPSRDIPNTRNMITKNIGMLLLAIYLIAVGILTLTGLGIGIITGVLALLAGIFILIGR